MQDVIEEGREEGGLNQNEEITSRQELSNEKTQQEPQQQQQQPKQQLLQVSKQGVSSFDNATFKNTSELVSAPVTSTNKCRVDDRPKYRQRAALILGAFELFVGILMIILPVILYSNYDRTTLELSLTASIPILVCGILSLITSKFPKGYLLVFLKLTSIISSMLMLMQIVFPSISISEVGLKQMACNFNPKSCDAIQINNIRDVRIINIFLIILILSGFALTFSTYVTTCLCCFKVPKEKDKNNSPNNGTNVLPFSPVTVYVIGERASVNSAVYVSGAVNSSVSVPQPAPEKTTEEPQDLASTSPDTVIELNTITSLSDKQK